MAIAIGKEILKVTNEMRRNQLGEEDVYRETSVETRDLSPEL
jgi:hypothetical protein